MAKAMKAMKAMKVAKGNLKKNGGGTKTGGEVMKRPAGTQLALPKESGMSLEEKMEQFAKKENGNVMDFLNKLTNNQREALWGRFARARDALKDSGMQELWSKHCKGSGSDANKKALLKVFLQNKGDLKKNDTYQKELVRLSKVEGCLAFFKMAATLSFLHFACACFLAKDRKRLKSGCLLPPYSKGLACKRP